MRPSAYLLALTLAMSATACTVEEHTSDSQCIVACDTSQMPTTGGASEGSATGGSSSGSTTSDTGGPGGEPGKYGEACAPDDGPAVEFQIALDLRACTGVVPEDAPIFRITLFQGVDLPVGVHKLDGGLGFAYLDIGNGMPVSGTIGNLTVTAKTADGLVGTYDVTFENNAHITGTFDTIYCPQDVLCG